MPHVNGSTRKMDQWFSPVRWNRPNLSDRSGIASGMFRQSKQSRPSDYLEEPALGIVDYLTAIYHHAFDYLILF